MYAEGEASGGATIAKPVRFDSATDLERALWPCSDTALGRPWSALSICTIARRRLSVPASESALVRRAWLRARVAGRDCGCGAASSESHEYSDEDGEAALVIEGPSLTGLAERGGSWGELASWPW